MALGQKKIDVIGQMILSAIPAVIPQLYAFYRIKKFKKGVLVLLATISLFALDFIIDLGVIGVLNHGNLTTNAQNNKLLEDVIGIMIGSLLPMYFARKWTLEYNEQIDTSQNM